MKERDHGKLDIVPTKTGDLCVPIRIESAHGILTDSTEDGRNYHCDLGHYELHDPPGLDVLCNLFDKFKGKHVTVIVLSVSG